MAADISFANAQNETKQGVQAEGKPVSEEEFTEGEPVSEEEFTEEEAVSEEESTEEGSTSGDEFVEAESEESTLEEESFPEEGELSEERACRSRYHSGRRNHLRRIFRRGKYSSRKKP